MNKIDKKVLTLIKDAFDVTKFIYKDGRYIALTEEVPDNQLLSKLDKAINRVVDQDPDCQGLTCFSDYKVKAFGRVCAGYLSMNFVELAYSGSSVHSLQVNVCASYCADIDAGSLVVDVYSNKD